MFELKKYGELKIDNVLFEANYPVLFTCVNENDVLFLVVCCQNNAEKTKWLITKTTEEIVIDMLKDGISIREAFLKNPECQVTVQDAEELVVKEHDADDWGENSIYLPKVGEFINAAPGEIDEEIEYYSERMFRKQAQLRRW